MTLPHRPNLSQHICTSTMVIYLCCQRLSLIITRCYTGNKPCKANVLLLPAVITSVISTYPGDIQVEESLGELLILCQRSEEYTQYLLSMLARGAASAAASGAATPSRPAGSTAGTSKSQVTSARENAFRTGPFCTAVRELVSCYTHLVHPHWSSCIGSYGLAHP